MHATTMHRAFLDALNPRNMGSPLGRTVVATIKLHGEIQARQQREREEAQRKQAERLTNSLDVV